MRRGTDGTGRGCAAAFMVLLLGALSGAAQSTDEPVTVSTEHPRLFLRPARLRLLRRERERASARWQQFELFMAGKAPMQEPGFAGALYYQVSGNADAGKQAISYALSANADLRQQAIVFDWCQELMTEGQKRDLTGRLQKGIAAADPDSSVAAARSRAMAAVALYDHVPQTPQRELERIVRAWWGGKMVPALKGGKTVVQREDAYPLVELLHVIRDNANIDLRETFARFFREYPIEHLLSHYPAIYEAPDGEYRIGASRKIGSEPDIRGAALSRAAELAMVAYDTNAAETQVLQGWLMHDRFILRGTFGTPYEFLWANPYQPGLSYYHVPLFYYSSDFGKLYVRSTWDEAAKWFASFDGVMQYFDQGRVFTISEKSPSPLPLESVAVYLGQTARKFRVDLVEEEAAFIVGLEPRHTYQIEIDDEEMSEKTSDPGGIIELDLPRGRAVGVRLK